MPEDSVSNPEPPADEPKAAEEPVGEEPEEDVGDFINRHVMEKDSVFFEG